MRLLDQSIASFLAELPREKLEEMRDQARALQTHVAVEIKLLDDALAQQARRDGRSGGRGLGGETRMLVLKAVASFSEPVTPALVVDTIKASGATTSKGAIRNMVQRLAKEGDLERVSAGLYQLARPQPIASAERDAPTVLDRVVTIRQSAFAPPDKTSPNGPDPRGGDQEQSSEAGARLSTG